MAKLKPYPRYKDSGVPWLVNIPAHWDLVKMKYLLSERKEKGFPGEPLLAATQTKGVILKNQYENRTVLALKDLHLLKLVERGDYVISLRSFQGGIEYAHFRGIISPAYTILKPSARVQRGFFEPFFKSAGFVSGLSLCVTGIREGQNIDYVRLSRMPMPVPPVEEQLAIGRYLRAELGKINQIIRAKRRLIELLNEQKQAIIQRAVTRGLDPDVRLKPSGIDWLGDVPGHWGIWQIGHIAKVGNGSTPSRGNRSYWNDTGYPWLNSSSVNRTFITSADQFVTDLALRECHLPQVQPDSVLVAITGQGKTRGKAAILRIEATINQHIAYIAPQTRRMSSEFLHLELTAAYTRLRAVSDDSGSTKGALTCEDLKHFRIALPPQNEQIQVVTAVRKEVQELEVAIDKAQREIDLIREYRIRLITDVVTGKLDVRDVELPALEETEEELTAEEDATGDAIEPDAELETAEEHVDVAD